MAGFIVALTALLAVDPAFALHAMAGATPTSFSEGLLSGLGHPVIGLDHLKRHDITLNRFGIPKSIGF